MPDFCWNDTGALGRPASDTYEDLTHLDKTGASAYRRLIRQLVDGQRHSDCPIDFSPLPTRARCSARPERLTGRMQIHENPVSILAAWSPITKCMSLASVHCNPRQNGLQGLKRARSSVRIERWSPEPKVPRSNRGGRILGFTFKWPLLFRFLRASFIKLC